MKFAKELEEDLVPEWRIKYVDYKACHFHFLSKTHFTRDPTETDQGKKKIKAVTRAIRNAQRSPRPPLRWKNSSIRNTLSTKRSPNNDIVRASSLSNTGAEDPTTATTAPLEQTESQPIHVPSRHQTIDSQDSNYTTSPGGTKWRRYGSIVGSPITSDASRPLSLNLGEPALDTTSDDELLRYANRDHTKRQSGDAQENPQQRKSGLSESPSAFEIGRTKSPSGTRRAMGRRHASDSVVAQYASERDSPASQQRSDARHKQTRSSEFTHNHEDPLFMRMFSRHGKKPLVPVDVPMESWVEVNSKQDDFWDFLDAELKKVEDFYKSKEEEATSRLDTIKRQLHILRDHRQKEVEHKRAELRELKRKRHENGEHEGSDDGSLGSLKNGHSIAGVKHIPHTKDMVRHPIKAAKQVQFGASPKIMGSATPPSRTLEQIRDYTRKPADDDPSYKGAKTKLKRAMQEYYRGLELLKSYAILNRTAFRKINKKYDKAVQPSDTLAYLGKVNQAWFVKSGLIDEYITAIEDLYARYFYSANRKVAASKLRRKNRLPDAFTQSVFRNGLLIGLGLVLSIEGLVRGAREYYGNTIYENGRWIDSPYSERISYIMQIYAGYFLLLLLMFFFCLVARVFHRAKVNYVFIFEFDTRHNLDWRQLVELPSVFLFLMGLVMYLNFHHAGGDNFLIWWPLVLISVTVAITVLPLPTVYHESRKWFLISLGRLLMPWLPVEFRDFFLGDMMCSETYAFGGIELFFCLYINQFNDPSQCNSSNSRLFGFLQTLPGIIRLLQCFRRYWDTRQAFPHLVNGGKYTFTILQYASLSAFRINKTPEMRAFFITCGTLNGLATSIWDLFIDWSLMDPTAKHKFLRQTLAYKHIWWYYAAIVIDPILRFNWIFYAIPYFTDELQHNTLLGFFIALSEVIRRGVWTIFRVENEHCTNVGKFKASRDVELPYHEEEESHDLQQGGPKSPVGRRHSDDHGYTASPQAMSPTEQTRSTHASGADIEAGRASNLKSPAASSLRQRQNQQGITPSIPSPGAGLAARVGTLLQGAHAQDFERKRRPSQGGDGTVSAQDLGARHDEEDDSEADGTEVDADAEEESADDAGPRVRARRALSSIPQSREERNFDERVQRDMTTAVDALRRGQGERSSGEEEEEEEEEDESGGDEGELPNPAGAKS